MHQRVTFLLLGDESALAKIVVVLLQEEAGLSCFLLLNEIGEDVVAALDKAVVEWEGPFREDNRPQGLALGLKRERVPVNDVPSEQVV